MKRLARFFPPAYVFLAALWPLLAYYQQNEQEVLFSFVLKPALFLLVATYALYWLVRWPVQDRAKAGLIVTVFLFAFFKYPLFAQKIPLSAHQLVPLIFFITVLVAMVVLKTRRSLKHWEGALTWIGVALVLFSLFGIGKFELGNQRVIDSWHGESATFAADTERPDIYYFIWDRYANPHTLKDMYGFDDSSFTESLQSLGFYVADKSTGNYPHTIESVTSSLNMNYLDQLTTQLGKGNASYTALADRMENNQVVRILESNGYLYDHLGSWWETTNHNSNATTNFSPTAHTLLLSEFASNFFFYNTPLNEYFVGLTHRDAHSDAFAYQKEQLTKIPQLPGPKFVFAHILMPHDPYIFDAQCRPTTADQANALSELQGYLGQLQCTNINILAVMKEIIAKSPRPPIIILQSDEGPNPILNQNPGDAYNWKAANDGSLNEKFRILNAYYVPGMDTGQLYPTITPVNSFRLIFNNYFRTNFPLLPDKNYIYADASHPYDYREVTNRITF